MKIGFNDDGVLTAVHSTGIESTGLYNKACRMNLDNMRMTKCKNLKSETRSLYTNTVRVVTNRGYRWGPGIVHTAIEAISAEMGMDPTEVLMRNIHTTEPSLKAVLEAGKSRMGWNWHPANSKQLPNGKMHGTAVEATVQCHFGGYAVFDMYFGNSQWCDGKFYIQFRAPYIHGGIADGCAMVVAEELGAKYEDVIATYGSPTNYGGISNLIGGSAWTGLAFAAKEAAISMREQMLDAAAASLKVTPEELDIEDSVVYVKADPEQNVPFSNWSCGPRFFLSSYAGSANDWPGGTKSDRNGVNLYCMNTIMAEVEVDTDTGMVELTNLTGVVDAGKLIRPTSFEAQGEGLLVWTIGNGLTEDVIWDKGTGVMLNRNALEYKIPTLLDCDMMDFSTVETRNGGGVYGSVGIAEYFHDMTIICCAVHNAIGKWVSMPATPEKVLKALGKA